jgi:hypothetical protein
VRPRCSGSVYRIGDDTRLDRAGQFTGCLATRTSSGRRLEISHFLHWARCFSAVHTTTAMITARGSTLSPQLRFDMRVYAIKVTLLGTRPPIWRRFLVEPDITLGHLHSTLQIVMGWTNSHLHQFLFQKRKQADGAKLGDVIASPGSKLLYEYDFGDCWQHELLLEEILNRDESFQRTCVAGARCCPPEDCGGPHGFRELLDALNDTSHPEHEFFCEWLEDGFDAEHFSVEEVNRRLQSRRRSHRRRPVAED